MSDDELELDAYVSAAWPRLVRAAVLLGCSPHEAEDVAQTALTTCFVRWSRVRRAGDRDAYVHRLLVNTFLDSRRRRWHGERPTEHLPEHAVEGDAESFPARDAVARSLSRLTTDQRVAVVLRCYLDLPESEMAAVLRVRPGTVKSRLSRALAALVDDPDLAELLEAR
jgi:RNA polymerase sigma-70 factor (sigma-E family)